MENLKHIMTFEQLSEDIRQKGYELYQNKSGKDFWGDRGAGILPVYLGGKQVEFLVGLRGPQCNEPGTWGVWGGMIEKGEKPEIAAKREFIEESGYEGPIDLVQSYIYKTDGFQYYNYLGVVSKKFEADLMGADAWETTDAKWVTMAEMKKLELHFGLKSLIEHGKKEIDALASRLK